jgi:hypothetical protein
MADCSYHPGKDAVGACVSCGKMVCIACRTELQEKVYCQPCANKLFISKADIPTGGPATPVIQTVSGAWWLLPVFFGWLGGLIAWAVTKARDPKKARSMLILGIILSVVAIIIGGIILGLTIAGVLVFTGMNQ